MPHDGVSHIFRIQVGGGERHRFGILLAAEIAAAKGWRVHDTTSYSQSPFRPDLIISKTDRYASGPFRKNRTTTFWIDVVDSHDPRPDWKAKGLPCDDVLIIDIGKCANLDECVNVIRRSIP